MNASETSLYEEIHKEGILSVAGIFDAFTARIAVKAGFKAVYMTGSGSSTALLGKPDIGLLTMTEMIANASHIVDAVNVPVIADADTGYGNAMNVLRTVREYEKAGVAGIHIEDQVAPKKCGHMEGKQLVAAEEMVGKIKAAIDAKINPEFIIIARTDARSLLGFEETVRRARLYRDAGADMIFGEALQSKEELRDFVKLVDAPCFTDSTEWGKTPLLPVNELGELGYKIVVFSTAAMRVTHKAVEDLMVELVKTGTQTHVLSTMKTRQETYDLVGYSEYTQLENRYLPPRD